MSFSGDPAIGESEPLAPMEKIEIEFEEVLAAYKNFPAGSMASPKGFNPALLVRLTSCSFPAVTLKPTIRPSGRLPAVTKRNFPEGVSCIFSGTRPMEKGEPATDVSLPVLEAIEKTEIFWEAAFIT